MAKDKKGFMLYADQQILFNELPDELAGKLIKHIYSYVNDESPQTDDIIIKVAFAPIKAQLKRDLDKYLKTCDKNKENALIRWNKKDATACDRMPTDAKHADKDIDKDNDKDSFNRYIDYINKSYNRKFRFTESAFKSYKQRLKEYTKEELRTVIINSHRQEYHKENNYKYLTPQFLLRVDKIEMFLNIVDKPKDTEVKKTIKYLN